MKRLLLVADDDRERSDLRALLQNSALDLELVDLKTAEARLGDPELQAVVLGVKAAERLLRAEAERDGPGEGGSPGSQTELERQFLGIVTHDLRNPISTMMLAAWTLQNRNDVPPDGRKLLDKIMSNGDRAARLIRELLDLSQACSDAGLPIEPRPMDLHPVVTKVVEELRAAHPGRDLHLEVAGDGRGAWDEERIAQLFGHLLTNAVLHGAPDVPVSMRISDLGTRVKIEVHNGGPKIPESVRATLFQPVKRANRVHEPHRSLALGLTLVKAIARAHGGTVEVDSDDARGTTFSVVLPRASDS